MQYGDFGGDELMYAGMSVSDSAAGLAGVAWEQQEIISQGCSISRRSNTGK